MSVEQTRSSGIADFKKGRVPREVRVRQLVGVAEELLLESGFEQFSIEQLCRAAGVSRPVVYEHFGSKEGIYLAVQRHVRNEFDAVLLGALDDAHELTAAIRAASDAFFGILERDPERWLMVFGSTTVFVGPMAEDLWNLRVGTVERIAMLVTTFAPSLEDQDAEFLAHSIAGSGEGLGRWWYRNRHVSREVIVGWFVDTVSASIEDAERRAGDRPRTEASSG